MTEGIDLALPLAGIRFERLVSKEPRPDIHLGWGILYGSACPFLDIGGTRFAIEAWRGLDGSECVRGFVLDELERLGRSDLADELWRTR